MNRLLMLINCADKTVQYYVIDLDEEGNLQVGSVSYSNQSLLWWLNHEVCGYVRNGFEVKVIDPFGVI